MEQKLRFCLVLGRFAMCWKKNWADYLHFLNRFFDVFRGKNKANFFFTNVVASELKTNLRWPSVVILADPSLHRLGTVHYVGFGYFLILSTWNLYSWMYFFFEMAVNYYFCERCLMRRTLYNSGITPQISTQISLETRFHDIDFQSMAMFVCFKGSMAVVCQLPDQFVDICRVPHGHSSIL